jgi:hypothetical protein
MLIWYITLSPSKKGLFNLHHHIFPMAASVDILLHNNDLVIINGDITTGLSDAQHVEDTINAAPGWWKENPADGVGVMNYLNSEGQEQDIKRAITLQLQSDGYQVTGPVVEIDTNGLLTIIPNATKL